MTEFGASGARARTATPDKFSSICRKRQVATDYLRESDIYDENLKGAGRFSSFWSHGTSLTWAPVRLLTSLSAMFSHRSVIFLSDRMPGAG